MAKVVAKLMKDANFRRKSSQARLEYALFILNLSKMKRDRISNKQDRSYAATGRTRIMLSRTMLETESYGKIGVEVKRNAKGTK